MQTAARATSGNLNNGNRGDKKTPELPGLFLSPFSTSSLEKGGGKAQQKEVKKQTHSFPHHIPLPPIVNALCKNNLWEISTLWVSEGLGVPAAPRGFPSSPPPHSSKQDSAMSCYGVGDVTKI